MKHICYPLRKHCLRMVQAGRSMCNAQHLWCNLLFSSQRTQDALWSHLNTSNPKNDSQVTPKMILSAKITPKIMCRKIPTCNNIYQLFTEKIQIYPKVNFDNYLKKLKKKVEVSQKVNFFRVNYFLPNCLTWSIGQSTTGVGRCSTLEYRVVLAWYFVVQSSTL